MDFRDKNPVRDCAKSETDRQRREWVVQDANDCWQPCVLCLDNSQREHWDVPLLHRLASHGINA